MATKPAKTARVFHYFTSSCFHWCAEDDRAECERRQREVDHASNVYRAPGYNLWKVPGPALTTTYSINHFAPQIEGAEFLEFVPYVDEKELPPKRLRKPRAAARVR